SGPTRASKALRSPALAWATSSAGATSATGYVQGPTRASVTPVGKPGGGEGKFGGGLARLGVATPGGGTGSGNSGGGMAATFGGPAGGVDPKRPGVVDQDPGAAADGEGGPNRGVGAVGDLSRLVRTREQKTWGGGGVDHVGRGRPLPAWTRRRRHHL